MTITLSWWMLPFAIIFVLALFAWNDDGFETGLTFLIPVWLFMAAARWLP